MLGNGQRQFERINRIEAQIAAKQGRFRIDITRFYPIDVQALDEQGGELVFGRRLGGRVGRCVQRDSMCGVAGGKMPLQCIIRAPPGAERGAL